MGKCELYSVLAVLQYCKAQKNTYKAKRIWAHPLKTEFKLNLLLEGAWDQAHSHAISTDTLFPCHPIQELSDFLAMSIVKNATEIKLHKMNYIAK